MRSAETILVCHNEPVTLYANYTGKEVDGAPQEPDLSESEFFQHLQAFTDSLSRSFDGVHTLSVSKNLVSVVNEIRRVAPDVIFNLVESLDGRVRYEFAAAALFEIMGIPYTGNHALCLGTCLDKPLTKTILRGSGINTPRFEVIARNCSLDDLAPDLDPPLIVKLVEEDASIGISELSVVRDRQSLVDRTEFLFENYDQDVLVEEYIDGRELNVSILGGDVLPIAEILFDGLPDRLPPIVTYEAKWHPASAYYAHSVPRCPARLPESVARRVGDIGVEAYRALKCRDYARVDLRLDSNDEPYVLEVNPNPDISPDAGFVRSAQAAGISYDELLFTIARLAVGRAIDADTEGSSNRG